VQLAVHAAPGLVINSDERCLRQMLLNLVSNAIKYGRCGHQPAPVTLSALAHGDAVLVSVADQGEGMTPEQLALLFRPFERLGQEAGSQPGSGLGLVITQQLGQLLGVEIKLRSQPGGGTTATLRIPL
jgi:signal transduction histidine kinase